MYTRPAHQPKRDYVAADKITKSVLLYLAAKYPVLWTYPGRKPRKLYFSCDNSGGTNAHEMLDFAACEQFLEKGTTDKLLKQDPKYAYWHVIVEAPLVKKARKAEKAARDPKPTIPAIAECDAPATAKP